MNIVWKPVPFDEYKNIYEVSSYGDVRRIDNKRERRQYQHKNGYMHVLLCHEGKQLNISVHRLVALTFIPNPNPEIYNQVGHQDEDKTNNKVENLYWTNAQENNTHGRRLDKQLDSTDKKRENRKARKRGRKIPVLKIVPTSVSGATTEWYCSIAEASRENNIGRTDIKAACCGIRATAGGYVWCYFIMPEDYCLQT